MNNPSMSDSDDALLEERSDAVLILRLNRPASSNALTARLMGDLGNRLLAADADPTVRAVILCGTGDRTFCAGMDLKHYAGVGEPTKAQQRGIDVVVRFMREGGLTIPVIGAANGTAVGGGLELLLGCDVVVASETARFGFPEVKRGLFAAGSGILLATRIPLVVALEMTLTGDSISADRAYQLGMVNRTVPSTQVLDAAIAIAERMAANGPLALQATKELVRLATRDLDHAVERQEEWHRRVFSSEDALEGAAAYTEKRAPIWLGR
jgi:enoyl-CoA hydratase/carnithine racemase